MRRPGAVFCVWKRCGRAVEKDVDLPPFYLTHHFPKKTKQFHFHNTFILCSAFQFVYVATRCCSPHVWLKQRVVFYIKKLFTLLSIYAPHRMMRGTGMDGSICCFFKTKLASCKVTFVLGIRSDFDSIWSTNKHWAWPDDRLVSWRHSTIMGYLIKQIMAQQQINQMDQRQLTTTMIIS